jgi:hypothetical protein
VSQTVVDQLATLNETDVTPVPNDTVISGGQRTTL